MMSAFFHFQHTLNRLFNNCIKIDCLTIVIDCLNRLFNNCIEVILILDKFLLKYGGGKGGQIDPPRKNYPQKAQPY